MLTIGIIFIFFIFKTLDYQIVFLLAPFFIFKTIIIFGNSFNVLDVMCLLLFLGAMGKSAQIGLHT
jgi:NADH-quinone oxidoreductase subunit L